jgi:pyruvate formate lyase activating enzyme
MATLAEELANRTRQGDLYESLEGNRIRCLACGHRCPIPAGFAGVCRIRFNRQGTLRVPFGYVSALQSDPIEKKPFFHAFPGSAALSFGMLGCSFHCAYCQNWIDSQALRDFRSMPDFRETSPDAIVRMALAANASSVISTYNEPLITAEWAAAVFRAARAAGLATGIVSNGSATPEVIQYLRPCLDLFKVDLKSMDDGRYHQLGGRLQPVLDSIAGIHAAGIWLEVVTLVIPGFNDSTQELEAAARFLARISPDIPWHVTAFHRDYKMTDAEDTGAPALLRAASIGLDAGLHYVYAGNLPGAVGRFENTWCPGCRALLVERSGHRVLSNRITPTGGCPTCGLSIPGRWSAPVVPHRSAVPLVHTRCG